MGTYALFRLESVPDGGGLPTAELLSLDRMPKPGDLADIGAAPEGWRIRRLRALDGRPVAVEEIWLDGRYEGLRTDHLSESLYKTYAERLGLTITRAEDRVGVGPLARLGARNTPSFARHHDGTCRTAQLRSIRQAGGGVAQLVRTRSRALLRTGAVTARSGRTTHMRYGIVGCGMMGQEHIRNIALLAQAEVSAFVEPDVGMAAATQALAPGAAPCPDLQGLLARNDVDALVIASPNHCHVPQLQDVARTRPLPVLVEKPVATRVEDDAALRDLARDYPAPIWVAMEYRYMPRPSRGSARWPKRSRAASRC